MEQKKNNSDEQADEVGGVTISQIYQDWKLVIIFAKKPAQDPNDKTHEHFRLIRQTLTDVLTQA